MPSEYARQKAITAEPEQVDPKSNAYLAAKNGEPASVGSVKIVHNQEVEAVLRRQAEERYNRGIK